MHDLDRTLQELEYDQEQDGFEYDNEYDQEYGQAHDEEYQDEYEYTEEYDDSEYEYESEYEYGDEEGNALFTEEEEMELAAELLSVGSEEELDQFIGRMFRRAGHRLRKFGRGLKKVARGAGRVVKSIAKKALPIAGRVVGGVFGGPLGSKLGATAGRAASRMFELELESLSPEDQEFEVARRVVRLAGSATKNAAKLGQQMPANRAIRQGFKTAARRHAPGLLKPSKASSGKVQRSGKWIMRDNKIIVLGL
ncbi:MAG TPA: hypothetical protein PKC76_12020 [Saprospiraceae bacterium]|nr:hypothetical protein [Saprospiraceae bacterium]HMP24855.1 hypothetical protein [Saprospiraceae bacterium]